MFSSSFPSVACRRAHVLFTLFVCLRIVVSNIYCVVFLPYFFFVFYTIYVASFSGLTIFLLSLRYSLTFINENNIYLTIICTRFAMLLKRSNLQVDIKLFYKVHIYASVIREINPINYVSINIIL